MNEMRIAKIKKPKTDQYLLNIMFTQIGDETFNRIKTVIGPSNVETKMAGKHPTQLKVKKKFEEEVNEDAFGEIREKLSSLGLKVEINTEQERIDVKQPLRVFVDETHRG